MKKFYALCCLLFLSSITVQAQSALHFDAIDDYVEIDTTGDAIYDFAGDFTIEAWIKAETGGFWPSVVSKFDNVSGARYGYWFGITGSGTVGIQVFDGTTGSWPSIGGTTNLKDATWHHIAGVMHSDTLKVYVDGALEGSLLSPFPPVFNDHPMWIGTDAESDIYHGAIDNVQLWDYARSGGEIDSTKNFCLQGSEAGLVGLYQFEEGAGFNVTDGSNYPNDGFLVNMDSSDWVAGYSCTPINPVAVDVQALDFISVYPNPSNGVVNIALGDLPGATVRVHNVLGQQVRQQTAISGGVSRLDLGQETGLYILTVETADGLQSHHRIILE